MTSRRVIALVVFVAVLGAAAGAALLAAGSARAATPGKVLWSKRMSTAYGRDDFPRGMAVAPDGSVYVVSRVRWGDNGDDTLIGLTKYSPGGTRRWQRTFRTSGALQDSPVGLALDRKGNAYVAGNTITAGGVNEGLLVRWTAAGKRSWVRRWAGTTTASDWFTDAACDPHGNVIVCGHENLSPTTAGFFVREYGPGGSARWTKRWGPGQSTGDGADAVAVDKKTGVVYVGGRLTQTVSAPDPSATDVVLLKFGDTGTPRWGRTWGSLGGWDDTVDDLVLSPSGEVYVAANVRDDMWGHAAVLNFGSGGTLHWSDSDADKSPDPGLLPIQGIAVDNRERVRVLLGDPPASPPALLRLYGPDGELRWQRELPLGATVRASAEDLAVTTTGRTYVAGFSQATNADPMRLFVMCVNGDGTLVPWTTYRTGPGGSDARGSLVALRDGRLYAAGYAGGVTTGNDVLTLRLVP